MYVQYRSFIKWHPRKRCVSDYSHICFIDIMPRHIFIGMASFRSAYQFPTSIHSFWVEDSTGWLQIGNLWYIPNVSFECSAGDKWTGKIVRSVVGTLNSVKTSARIINLAGT